MRINRVYIEQFKNLNKFCIELDSSQMNTVLLGQNATGKSNFIEALVLIFKYLDLSKPANRKFPDFNYWIDYKCYKNNIVVDYTGESYQIFLENNDKTVSYNKFFSKDGKSKYLPKYVFTYYSGLSDRLDKIFWEHQKNFYDKIIKKDFDKNELDDLRRLFYVKQIHSFFVLLAFFSLPKIENQSKDFLLDVLGIEDLESVLFVLKKSSWTNDEGDPRFWGADGLVKEFLSCLWDFSLAPIYEDKVVNIDFRRTETRKRLYLFLKDKSQLKNFAENYFNINNESPNNTFLFKALESTYISDILEEVKVKVVKKTDGKVTFKELSEGEQQLLTVLGLLIFTREDESLVLLDEPDTHLNPVWKYDYLYYLKKLVKSKANLSDGDIISDDMDDNTSQILINTHDPIVIGSMDKAQIRMFGKAHINSDIQENSGNKKFEELRLQALNFAIEPEISPRGLGVAGTLTSELFGLKSIIDRETQILLTERNNLMYKESLNQITENEKTRLQVLFEELSNKGFNHTFKDPLYTQYIIEKMEELNRENHDAH